MKADRYQERLGQEMEQISHEARTLAVQVLALFTLAKAGQIVVVPSERVLRRLRAGVDRLLCELHRVDRASSHGFLELVAPRGAA